MELCSHLYNKIKVYEEITQVYTKAWSKCDGKPVCYDICLQDKHLVNKYQKNLFELNAKDNQHNNSFKTLQDFLSIDWVDFDAVQWNNS